MELCLYMAISFHNTMRLNHKDKNGHNAECPYTSRLAAFSFGFGVKRTKHLRIDTPNKITTSLYEMNLLYLVFCIFGAMVILSLTIFDIFSFMVNFSASCYLDLNLAQRTSSDLL